MSVAGDCSVPAWLNSLRDIGQYSPPTGCNWTNVIFNLSMTSKGRQYDRLGHLFLGDIEVWRTSTAEPNPGGIVFKWARMNSF